MSACVCVGVRQMLEYITVGVAYGRYLCSHLCCRPVLLPSDTAAVRLRSLLSSLRPLLSDSNHCCRVHCATTAAVCIVLPMSTATGYSLLLLCSHLCCRQTPTTATARLHCCQTLLPPTAAVYTVLPPPTTALCCCATGHPNTATVHCCYVPPTVTQNQVSRTRNRCSYV